MQIQSKQKKKFLAFVYRMANSIHVCNPVAKIRSQWNEKEKLLANEIKHGKSSYTKAIFRK